jgi:ATP-binding protein involved in chromosome partitioning
VAVTSPQLISKIDVKKSIDTLLKFKIPLLGIIENMSGFKDATDNLIRIFPGSGAQELAYEYKVPLIASVAIITELSEATDAGRSLNTLKIDLPIEQYLL